MKTVNEIRKAFWSGPVAFNYRSEYHKSYRQNQYRADIRMAFCDHVEWLRQQGEISEQLAQRATL